MIEKIKMLCNLNGISGREARIRDYIIEKIGNKAEITADPLGNVIAFVKGRKRAVKKVMADAHMDEVGLIITVVTDDGFLKFATVGGIDTSVLMSRRVLINDSVRGVICSKPVHMLTDGEKDKIPNKDELFIDIGADGSDAALAIVSPGDAVYFDCGFENLGDLYVSKALDDRAGCAVLLDIIEKGAEYDFYATFTVQEEVGLRGARTAAYTVNPNFAVAVESTTAADIGGTPPEKSVCFVGGGAVLSFMDSATLYDRQMYEKIRAVADEKGIKHQIKCAVTGGNNAGAIHLSRGGVKTAAVSVPCRYIHSPSSVASAEDIIAVRNLTEAIIECAAAGNIP